MTGALMFAILVTAILAGAALAAAQVSRSRAAVEYSGIALLAVGDRLQVALDEVNTTPGAAPRDRLDTTEHCQNDVCTRLQVVSATADQIVVTVTATVPDGAQASRTGVLAQLPTSGRVTGVDSLGRLRFVDDDGTGTDLWRLLPGEER